MTEAGKEIGPVGTTAVSKASEGDSIALAKARARAWDAECELARVKEQLRLQGERRQQLEEILASHFARSVRMLSGAQRQFGESQDAARAVTALEDHLRALRLLNNNGVECDKVELGVRLLLDQRDRVVNAAGIDMGKGDAAAMVVVQVQEPMTVQTMTIEVLDPPFPALPSKP